MKLILKCLHLYRKMVIKRQFYRNVYHNTVQGHTSMGTLQPCGSTALTYLQPRFGAGMLNDGHWYSPSSTR